MKKKFSKIALAVLCATLLVCGSVLGTLAYLTAQTETVVNTFTVGQVAITLDETDTDNSDSDGNGDGRDIENTYHLMPGGTYVKDPTLTVKAGSEDSYLRIIMTVSNASEFDAIIASGSHKNPYDATDDLSDFTEMLGGLDTTNWALYSTEAGAANDTIYEFRYVGPTNGVYAGPDADETLVLMNEFSVPGTLTSDEIASLSGLNINFVAHAIQASGFADADAAWTAFEQQNP